MLHFNQTTSVAQLWTWFHITRVPEYVVGEGTLESWLTGFDLTPVSTGSLKLWEFYRDFNKNGTTYSLLFKAPANVLSQHGDNFTFNIGVSSYYHGYTFKTQQVIDINMPATTEVKTASPTDMSLMKGNTATFLTLHWRYLPVTILSNQRSLNKILKRNRSRKCKSLVSCARRMGSHWLAYSTQLHRVTRQKNMASETSSTTTYTRAWLQSTIFLQRSPAKFNQEMDNDIQFNLQNAS